jgi:AraC family transcriptional regulator, regulatory protein of adaptative response / methylated-DNA-[protein]-cysteine methyltransferase
MTDDDRWTAVQRRDRAADGQFVTGVLTTGIYCRPSCAARHPARGNVRFFTDGTAARAAGLRPYKHCLPDDVLRDEGAVLAAIAAIGPVKMAAAGRRPSLNSISARSRLASTAISLAA